MPEPKVSVIIVNFNGGEVFKDCLSSLKKIKYKNYETIIFDNASRDGTEKFATLKSGRNLGFVGGNNEAVKTAKGKYILLLNNDTKVPPNFLNILVEKMESDESIGVIQPKIYLMDKPGYLDNAGSFLTKIGFLRHWGFQKKDSKEYNTEKEIFSAKGACMLIRKKLIDKINLFDNDFFMYFEESDFCWRVWLSGSKVLFYPKTHVYHKVGYTIKRQNPLELNYHYYKNRITSLIKNLSTLNALWIVSLHLLLSLGIAIIFFIRGSIENPSIILRAIKWNIVNLKKTLKKRRETQKLRVVTDKYIFERVGKKVNMIKLFLFQDKFFKDFKRIEKDIAKKA